MTRKTGTLILLTLACVCGAAAAQAGLPQAAGVQTPPAVKAATTPAEQQFRAFLRAFNAGKRETYLAFLREEFPSRVARLDGDMGAVLRTGGFDLRKVESFRARVRGAPPRIADASRLREVVRQP